MVDETLEQKWARITKRRKPKSKRRKGKVIMSERRAKSFFRRRKRKLSKLPASKRPPDFARLF